MKTISDFSPHRPKEIFQHFSPPLLLEDLLKGTFSAYQAALEFVNRESIGIPQATYITPHLRRTYLEEAFEGIAARQRDSSVSSFCEKNRSDDAHQVIKCGPILITESKVDNSKSLPRIAAFRQTYARESQIPLFEYENKTILPENEEYLYAILVHKPIDSLSGCPEFIDIVFPSDNCQTIIDRIELYKAFPAVTQELMSTYQDAIKVRKLPATA